MKCPVCGYIFKSGNVCPDCGTDIVLYNKTRTISDRLYNSGLKCANERDLTGAVENLKKSLMVSLIQKPEIYWVWYILKKDL